MIDRWDCFFATIKALVVLMYWVELFFVFETASIKSNFESCHELNKSLKRGISNMEIRISWNNSHQFATSYDLLILWGDRATEDNRRRKEQKNLVKVFNKVQTERTQDV